MVENLYSGLLVNSIESVANKSPNKVVFISKGESISASQLFNNSKLIARNLKKNNFKENEVVLMAIEPGLEFIELIYALLMLRARIAIIDPEMGRENYASKIKQLSPNWMFVDSRLLFLSEWPILKNLIFRIKKDIPDINFNFKSKIVKVGLNFPLFKKHIDFKSLLIPTLNDLQLQLSNEAYDNFIVYTSGTLDVPKGVLHSDNSLNSTIHLLRDIIQGGEDDVVGTYLPHFMLLGVASNLVVKIMPVKLKAKEKLVWLNEEKINIFFGPPSELLPLIILCESTNRKFPDSVKHLMLGSAPVHQGFLKRLVNVIHPNTKITCTYGMTEHLLVAIADGRDKINYNGDGDLLGKIVSGVDVKINDDNEIIVKSNQLYSRYFHLSNRSDWHETGDLGKIDSNGNLVLLGRKKEMLIRKDFNIYPALYEGTIKKIPNINEAALIGLYDENIHDEKVYLALETEIENLDIIRKLLEKGEYSIDKQALPDFIFKMKIPRKGRQDKIDRNAILQHIIENKL